MISSISFRFKHFLESISPYSQRSIFQDWNYLSLYALKDSRVRLEFVMISIESSKNFLNQIIEGKEIRCLNFLSQLSLSSIRVNHELNWDEKTKDESWYDRSILSKSIWGICAYYWGGWQRGAEKEEWGEDQARYEELCLLTKLQTTSLVDGLFDET